MSPIIENNSVVIDCYWFSEIGFVLIQDKITRKYKCYIGQVRDGLDEIADTLYIMRYGSKFPLRSAKELFEIDFEKDWIQEHPEYFI